MSTDDPSSVSDGNPRSVSDGDNAYDRQLRRGAMFNALGIAGKLLHPVVLAIATGLYGAEILGLDPTFPLKFMIYFLIVVTVGGTTSITGPFLASLLLGIADVAGKYYVPSVGAFVIYTLMIVVLVLRPQGLFERAR